jgi:SAM-dependent methyltransferase
MIEREEIGQKMRDHYDRVWSGDNPWDFEGSDFDEARYARQLSILEGRRYKRVLEIGCGSGRFTRSLASISDHVLAIDISLAAIELARSTAGQLANVEFRAANVMELDLVEETDWDLIVMSETIYCLGWLYSFFDVGWLVNGMLEATARDGRFLLVNTLGKERDYLLRPWLIRTYRDLFINVGYEVEAEEILKGVKNEVDFEVLISLYMKPRAEVPALV